jgi:GNAT superfamily N-acetyltransferase
MIKIDKRNVLIILNRFLNFIRKVIYSVYFIYENRIVDIYVRLRVATADNGIFPTEYSMESNPCFKCIVADFSYLSRHWQSNQGVTGDQFLQTAQSRLSSGDRCYVLEQDGRPVGVGWGALRSPIPLSELGIELYFEENIMCLYDLAIFPDYRGKGLYMKLLYGIGAVSERKFLLIYADRDNVPSNRGIVRAGFIHCGSVNRRTIFGKTELNFGAIQVDAAEVQVQLILDSFRLYCRIQ